jgi:hypothetical protein
MAGADPIAGAGVAPPASAQAPPELADAPLDLRLTADEQELLGGVDRYLRRGVELQTWWRGKIESGGHFEQRFELGRTFNEPGASFGFFDTAPVDGQPTPVMGNFQEMFYDQPKQRPDGRPGAAEWMREQLRTFVLRYFMRVSDYREPQGFAETWRPPTSLLLQTISWCPRGDPRLLGFGFKQLYYKLKSGAVGRFKPEEAFAIVDLRELSRRYEWIVVKVCIFDFNLTFKPLGPGLPQISIPLQEDSLLVLSADFVADEERPAPGQLGRYGLGYAFIRSEQPSFFAYGPGQFDAAFERIDFAVDDDGRVRVSATFVANQPEQVVNVEVDPLRWGLAAANVFSLGMARRLFEQIEPPRRQVEREGLSFDPVLAYIGFANWISGGLAAETLCISREQLYKEFLVQHFMQHYSTLSGSLFVWRLVPDWLDEQALPKRVRTGKTA